MGIKTFFKVFTEYDEIKPNELSGRCIGIDISYEIYRTSLGMKNVSGLTDKNGEPTILLNILMANVSKFKKVGVKGIIYVFDNANANPLKLKECEKRKNAKLKAKANIEKCSNNEQEHKIPQLEKRTFTITNKMVDDVKKFLNYLNIPWITAPSGYEAEHLGAELMRQNIIDTFLTNDSDTLMFGGKSMLRPVKQKSKTVYHEYKLQKLLDKHNLKHEDLIKAGVILGSDFAEKTKGVGPKTVLNKLDIKLTDEQKKAYDHFASDCPFEVKDIYRSEDRMIEQLINWLVNDKNFNEKRIRKTLSVFS